MTECEVRTGNASRNKPGDRRLSRRDLWEPGGEIPPGDPTATSSGERQTRDHAVTERSTTMDEKGAL